MNSSKTTNKSTKEGSKNTTRLHPFARPQENLTRSQSLGTIHEEKSNNTSQFKSFSDESINDIDSLIEQKYFHLDETLGIMINDKALSTDLNSFWSSKQKYDLVNIVYSKVEKTNADIHCPYFHSVNCPFETKEGKLMLAHINVSHVRHFMK
jgi:hypothetical protein